MQIILLLIIVLIIFTDKYSFNDKKEGRITVGETGSKRVFESQRKVTLKGN